jgi:Mn-dependent DtxR family transcriptional regulator
LFSKDISELLGVSLRTAQRILQELRLLLHKEKHQGITVKEFAKHVGICPSEIVL